MSSMFIWKQWLVKELVCFDIKIRRVWRKMGKNWEGWEKEEREAGHLLSYHSREWWWGKGSLARRGKRGEHQLILGNRQPTALTILPQYDHLVITLSLRNVSPFSCISSGYHETFVKPWGCRSEDEILEIDELEGIDCSHLWVKNGRTFLSPIPNFGTDRGNKQGWIIRGRYQGKLR